MPDDALVPWFYRVLRNAVVDRFRRRGAEDRALAAFARELDGAEIAPAEVHGEICACIGRLAGTLKPEYGEALAAVDVHGTAVKDFAAQAGLSASNAGVRSSVPGPPCVKQVASLVRHLRRARLPRLLLPAAVARGVMRDTLLRRRDRRTR